MGIGVKYKLIKQSIRLFTWIVILAKEKPLS